MDESKNATNRTDDISPDLIRFFELLIGADPNCPDSFRPTLFYVPSSLPLRNSGS